MKIRAVVNQRRRGVEVEGTIVDMTPITLSRTRKTLMKATLENETGSITLNLWGSQSAKCKEVDRVRVVNAFTIKNLGKLEWNIKFPNDIIIIDSK